MLVTQATRSIGRPVFVCPLGTSFVTIAIFFLFCYTRFPSINRDLTMNTALELKRLLQSNQSVRFSVL